MERWLSVGHAPVSIRAAWGTAKAFQQTIPRMVCFHCLLTFLGGTLRVPFGLWGLLAPTPRRKLLKKLEQNFYVLLYPSTSLAMSALCFASLA